MANQKNIPPEGEPSKLKKWFKRVGVAGLLFFTLKGIAWLFIFYYGGELFRDCSGQ